jgi:hypothetical protein
MHNFVDQLPALIGVAVGILGTIFATTVTDRARWQRDQSVRWDERRLDAYAEYARVIKEIHTLALGLTAARMSLNWGRPIDREVGLTLLDQAEDNRTKTWEVVLLLGDSATVASAREWRNSVGKLVSFARDPSDDDKSAEWLLAVRATDEARDRFYEAARHSVNVRGGSVAQAKWLPSAQSGL